MENCKLSGRYKKIMQSLTSMDEYQRMSIWHLESLGQMDVHKWSMGMLLSHRMTENNWDFMQKIITSLIYRNAMEKLAYVPMKELEQRTTLSWVRKIFTNSSNYFWLIFTFLFAVEGDRKNGVTYVKYRRLLQTNDPVNDQAIPLDREVNVIAAIGPLNERNEANAHSHSDDSHTTEDVVIDFSAKGVHSCVSSLYDLKDVPKVKAWPTRTLRDQTTISVRIGPTGGNRGYTRITGEIENC